MEDQERTLEQWRVELETLRRAAEDEAAAVERLSHHLARAATAAALQEFPEIKNLSPEKIRAFGNLVNRTASEFAVKVAELEE
jgi:hypothetical protein